MGAIQNYNAGKEAYRGLNTVSESKSALSSFRAVYIGSAKAVRTKTESLDNAIRKIKSEYLPAKANPMVAELRKTYNAEVEEIRGRLSEKLNSILQAKEEACRKYVVIPPSADQLALLQSLQIRGAESISEEEWGMLIKTLAGNYQCASILEKIAKDGGKDFTVPFSPAEGLKNIQLFKARAETAIQNITDPEGNYAASEFMRDDIKDTITADLIETLDTEIATTVPSGDLTIKNRLKSASANALRMGDYDTFNEISNFIVDHVSVLSSPQEQEQLLQEQAEMLIAKGMGAKEKNNFDIRLERAEKMAKQVSGGKQNE